MYIKAKYPKVGREWYRQGEQGFGNLYGGNQISDVTNLDIRLSDGLISRLSTSYMFGGNIISVYVNTNNGNELVFTNESVFIIDSSTLNITEVNTQRALEFVNESDWVAKDVDLATSFIDRVSVDSGILDNQIGLDTIDESVSLLMLPNAYKDGLLYSVLPQDGTGDFDVVRGSNATRVNAGGIIETITGANTPRIDYTSGSPALLIEPQSTNLAAFSEDFTSWGTSGSPVLSNNQPSPDGENNAYLFENSSNGDRLQEPLGILTAGTYTQSMFVKYKDGDVRMNFKNNRFGGSNVFLITSSGVVAETPNANRHVEDYGNGWFRMSIIYTANGTSGSFIQLFGDLGTPKNGFYIFGGQLEEQSHATSYISTNGAIATRLEDTISVDLTSLSISSITETIDGVEQTPITSIPSTYTIPQGNIDKIVMI